MAILINELLINAVNQDASDIHLRVNSVPLARIHGDITQLAGYPALTAEDTANIANGLMSLQQKKTFKETNDVDLSYELGGLSRFRVNVFRERGNTGIVFRVIHGQVKSTEQLGLPTVLDKIAMEHRGIVLVTGATGSGKSTTLAAMLNYINEHRRCHILTIEDPIEYQHKNKLAVVSQREIGEDSASFQAALRAALRQDPDVILVGEMRDRETVEIGMKAAETGHLVLATLHTIDASETINRIISYFPALEQDQIRISFAETLNAIISQRLLKKKSGGRVAALEILISTELIKDMIKDKTKTKGIKDAIEMGASQYGMQSFDQSIYALEKAGLITRAEAVANCTNPDEYLIKMTGFSTTSESTLESMSKGEQRIGRLLQAQKKEEKPKKSMDEEFPFEQNPFA